MKKSRGINVAVVFLTMIVTATLASGDDAATKDVLLPAESIQWQDGPEGTKVAPLWGEWMKKGPFGVLVKFEAGVKHELHKHTHDLKIVILSGTYWHAPEGGKEMRFGPGSYLLTAGGHNHTSGCTREAACEFLMTSDDKFDFIPAK
jgi:hypothetical protein